jgi:hypothetical protein
MWRDTTLGAVWLFFNYTWGVKVGLWRSGYGFLHGNHGWIFYGATARVRPSTAGLARIPHLRGEMWGTRHLK